MKVSVCTLAKGREEHLVNLVLGLRRSHRPPAELIVAVMQANRYRLPPAAFPIRQIVMGGGEVPLARARNIAAAATRGDMLVFLDVDCIPAPTLVDRYAAFAHSGGVLMGEVGYLPKGGTAHGIDYELFEAISVRHVERPGPPPGDIAPCRDYRCFWSLNFAMTAAQFEQIGGFDERYVGYGGEDTDFARMVANAGFPLWWLRGAKAYHQYHPHHMPPVHHLDSVLGNAQLFAEKWGRPTMQPWLRAFELMGLAASGEHGWRKLREPTEADLDLTRQQDDQPYASSAAVLEALELEAASGSAGDLPCLPAPAIASR